MGEIEITRYEKHPGGSARSVAITYVCALGLTLAAGIGYRAAVSGLERLASVEVELEARLETFPLKIGDWEGEDLEISQTVLKVAGNDDYLLRRYRNVSTGEAANIYVAYSATPRRMLGHRPGVCYPGSGWVHDQTEETELVTLSGIEMPCLVHRFHRPIPQVGEVVVLNYYILNGVVTNNHDDFSGLKWRAPNLSITNPRYVTQVQISSLSEHAVLSAAKVFVDKIL